MRGIGEALPWSPQEAVVGQEMDQEAKDNQEDGDCLAANS
jgi:hypothetical protein